MTQDLSLQTTVTLWNREGESTSYELNATLFGFAAFAHCSFTISNHEFGEAHTDRDLMRLGTCLLRHLKEEYREEYGLELLSDYTSSIEVEPFAPTPGGRRARMVKIEEDFDYTRVDRQLPAMSFHVLFTNTAAYDRTLGELEAAQ